MAGYASHYAWPDYSSDGYSNQAADDCSSDGYGNQTDSARCSDCHIFANSDSDRSDVDGHNGTDFAYRHGDPRDDDAKTGAYPGKYAHLDGNSYANAGGHAREYFDEDANGRTASNSGQARIDSNSTDPYCASSRPRPPLPSAATRQRRSACARHIPDRAGGSTTPAQDRSCTTTRAAWHTCHSTSACRQAKYRSCSNPAGCSPCG